MKIYKHDLTKKMTKERRRRNKNSKITPNTDEIEHIYHISRTCKIILLER